MAEKTTPVLPIDVDAIAAKHDIDLSLVDVDIDPDAGLVNFNIKHGADPSKVGDVSGLMLTAEGAVVSQMFDRGPRVFMDGVNNPLDEIRFDGDTAELYDENGTKHVIKKGRFEIRRGYDGTLMRVIKFLGKTYLSSARRIDPKNARWQNSPTFTQMWKELGGPEPSSLFAADVETSPLTHIFMMIHPENQAVSRIPLSQSGGVAKGLIMYLGSTEVWTRPNAPVPDDRIGVIDEHEHLRIRSMKEFRENNQITVQEANEFLAHGFLGEDKITSNPNFDTRLRQGEFVIIHLLDENGKLEGTLRVESQSYAWRDMIYNSNPNYYHQLHLWYSAAKRSRRTIEEYREYSKLFPIVNEYDYKQLQKMIVDQGEIRVWPGRMPYSEHEAWTFVEKFHPAFYNIFVCMLMAVPLDRQKKIIGLYGRFFDDRTRIVKWLQSKVGIESPDSNHRVQQILTEARRRTDKNIKEGNYALKEKSSRGKKKLLSSEAMTKLEIEKMINYEERGESLWNLYKALRDEDRAAERQARSTEDFAAQALSELEVTGKVSFGSLGR